jgi:hypothetical protein
MLLLMQGESLFVNFTTWLTKLYVKKIHVDSCNHESTTSREAVEPEQKVSPRAAKRKAQHAIRK